MGRPVIADQEVVEAAGARLVLVRCKACGQRLRGVRRMRDDRLVVGMPWVQLNRAGSAIFPVTCGGCGSTRSMRERDLVRLADDAPEDGPAVPIRV